MNTFGGFIFYVTNKTYSLMVKHIAHNDTDRGSIPFKSIAV